MKTNFVLVLNVDIKYVKQLIPQNLLPKIEVTRVTAVNSLTRLNKDSVLLVWKDDDRKSTSEILDFVTAYHQQPSCLKNIGSSIVACFENLPGTQLERALLTEVEFRAVDDMESLKKDLTDLVDYCDQYAAYITKENKKSLKLVILNKFTAENGILRIKDKLKRNGKYSESIRCFMSPCL